MRVTFAETLRGKLVCLDPNPGWAGTYRIEQGQNGKLWAKLIPKGSGPSNDRHRLHLLVCAARVGVS